MAERRTFGVTVLGGLVAGTAAAVAGSHDWVSLIDGSGSSAAAFAAGLGTDLSAPPVTATALVLLASWGVVLVTRGRFRRAIAWLGLVAAVATMALAVVAWLQRPGEVDHDLRQLDVAVGRTGWAHLAVLAGLAAVATSLVAVRRVGEWPEMGRRYDAPADHGAQPVTAPAGQPEDSLDLWKALDEGRDPTAGPDH